MEFIYVQTENTALSMERSGVMGEGMATNHQWDSAAGDFSRVTVISGQSERHLPFRTSQGMCLTELPGWQQAQPPACRDGTEKLLSPKSSVSSPQHVQAHPETKLCLSSPSGTYGSISHVLHEASLSQRQNETIKTPGVKPEGKIKQEEN